MNTSDDFYGPFAAKLDGQTCPAWKQFRTKRPYQESAFTRNALRVIDLTHEPKDVTHNITILDDEGQAYILNRTDSEVKVALSEGKWVVPSFFRISSYPVVNTEDTELVPGLEDYARTESIGAIFKQEDAKLCLLLESLINDQDEKFKSSHSLPVLGGVRQDEYDRAVAAIRSNELEVARLLVNPLSRPQFSDIDFRFVWVQESVMVPRSRAYLLTESDYLGAFVTMYGIREVPNNTPEMFKQGLVLDEMVSMMILNPGGVVEFRL